MPCPNFPNFIDWGLSCINHWWCLCNVCLQCLQISVPKSFWTTCSLIFLIHSCKILFRWKLWTWLVFDCMPTLHEWVQFSKALINPTVLFPGISNSTPSLPCEHKWKVKLEDKAISPTRFSPGRVMVVVVWPFSWGGQGAGHHWETVLVDWRQRDTVLTTPQVQYWRG